MSTVIGDHETPVTPVATQPRSARRGRKVLMSALLVVLANGGVLAAHVGSASDAAKPYSGPVGIPLPLGQPGCC